MTKRRFGRRGKGGHGGGRAGGVFGKMAGHLFPSGGRGRHGGHGGGPGGRRGAEPRRGRRRGGTEQSQARPNDVKSTSDDPIDVVTGEVLLTQTDVSLPGVLPLLLRRTHNSSYAAGGLFGRRWASTLDQALEIDSAGAHFLGEDATVRRYPQVLLPNVEFRPTAGPQHPLVLTSDGGYRLTDPQSGTALHFPAPGETTGWTRLPVTAITDRNGNRIDFVYADQVLTEIRHSAGHRITVDTAPLDDTGERRVTALRLDDVTLVRFGYDAEGNLSEVYNSSGLPLKLSYDDEDRLTGWEDRNGFWYRYEYDDEGRAVRGTGSDGFLDSTLSYDPENNRTVLTDALGHATEYRYNDSGQVIEEIDPLGGVIRSTWDRFDRLLSRTDQLGATTRHTYDEHGNLTSTTYADGTTATAVYDDRNLPVEITRPDGTVWRQEYDERGNLVRLTDPLGAVTALTYDERGARTGVTDPLGAVTRAENDANGLPVAVTDARGAVERYAYDALGRVTTYTDAAGNHVRFGWTVEGRQTFRTLPDGATERWEYDPEGNEVAYTDPLGQVTRTEYGPFDTPTTRTRPDGSHLTFTHDARLTLTAVTTSGGLTWRYEHDAAGRLVAETDFNGRVLRYATDAAGRLTARTNGAGQTTTYTRDALGNTLEKRAGTQTTTFAYDAMGRMTRAVNADADLAFSHDAAGRVIAETCNGATLTLTRDLAGRVTARRTPSGAESHWTYDATGRPSRLETAGQTLTFTHDALGRETERRIGTDTILSQQWDVNDRLTAQSLWGAPSRPEDQARLLQHRTYTYRPDGHLTATNDRLNGNRTYTLDARGRVTNVSAQNWTERYAYDDAGNVTQADWPTAPDAADETGPRTFTGTLIRNAGRTRYEHDAQGRIVLREQVTLSGKRRRWHFHWDADDRLIGVETPDNTRWRYHYDALGRRTAKQQLTPDGRTAHQTYTYTWDDTRLVEETHRTWDQGAAGWNTVVTTWSFLPGSRRVAAQETAVSPVDGARTHVVRRVAAVITDLVGTPRELVHVDGTVEHGRQTPLWSGGAGIGCPLRFPGQYADPETGLHYNLHRYYDPATGAYLSADPLGFAAGPNPHGYVPNPMRWIDPLGLFNCHDERDEDGRLKLYRAPGHGNREAERYGPDPANHQGHGSDVHLGNSPKVAQQYAEQGTHEDGYYEYTMKHGFEDAFPRDEYFRTHDNKPGEYQWIIPREKIPQFNSYIDHDRTRWWNYRQGYSWED
ncbi:DUF6531 domain-containing protein [Actinomadura rayongensis]|uniref:Type IV secretion protein Rhs n=1 Tax=Actinomadura rayongensis TaxID=1429076 RepID=A0A6I4VZM6_9ACTN|nr:DUF6531 domain-containing protein [Actinomadura rayongensis]MXQ63799.1 type IV secretion protein Rhs [Actinomadura rayongensis]